MRLILFEDEVVVDSDNCIGFFFQAEDGIRDLVRSRGLGDVYKRQLQHVSGNLVELGFEAGDLKWKEIAADTKEQKRYILSLIHI